MLFKDLVVAKNRHLTVYEKNRVIKLFDDKSKKIPESLSDELSDTEVIDVEETPGLTAVVLDCGTTLEAINKEKKAIHESTKRGLNKLALTSSLLMASLGGGRWY